MNTAIATTKRKPNSPMSVFTIWLLYDGSAFRGEPRHFANGTLDLSPVPLLVVRDEQRPLVKIDLSKYPVRPLHLGKIEIRRAHQRVAQTGA